MNDASAPPLVDTNIILRFMLQDVPDQWSRAHAIFADIEAGVKTAQISSTIVFECVYVLQSHYAVTRFDLRKAFLPVLAFQHLTVPDRLIYPDVFDLYVARKSLSFADCYHAILARHLGIGIISFDRGFDRIPGLVRIEP